MGTDGALFQAEEPIARIENELKEVAVTISQNELWIFNID